MNIFADTHAHLSQGEINSILDNADELAKENLGGSKEGNAVEIHHHHHDSHWWTPFFWPSSHTTIINGDSRSGVEAARDDNNATRLLIGVGLSIAALATSYFIGKDFGHLSDAIDEMGRVDQELWSLERVENTPKTRKIYQILTDERRLLSSKRNDTLIGLTLKVSMIAAAAFGIAGAIYTIPAFMVGGVVGGVACGAAMLVKMGYNHSSHRWERQAQRILKDIEETKLIASA